jgi:membrane-associated protein
MLGAGHLLGGVPFVAAHVEVLSLGIVALSILPAAVSVLDGRRRGTAPETPDTPADELTGVSAS